MGKKFFSGWALWEQMTFVLACGIAVTVIVGLIKLRYDHYRIAKYSKVPKPDATKTPEMLEAQKSDEPEDDVPFGIRAIESGIEIDGVWISRGNTPVGSCSSSLNDVRLPRSNNNSQLELPQPVHGSSNSRNSSRAPSSNFDRAVSAEILPSRSPSPGALPVTRSRPPVLPNPIRNSSALQVLEGRESSSSTTVLGTDATSSRSSDESDYMHQPIPVEARPYEAAYLNPRHSSLGVPGSIDPRTDLDLLQSHRLSHVAETGQLTPRVRRPGYSGEWTAVAENVKSPEELPAANGIDYFVPRQNPPSPPFEFDASHESAPGSHMAELPGHPATSSSAAPAYYDAPGMAPAPLSVATPYVQRDPRVLRKVNSGFEILHPGSLETSNPSSPEEETDAAHPADKRQSRKLQKKRRSSSGSASRVSHFVEQV